MTLTPMGFPESPELVAVLDLRRELFSQHVGLFLQIG
jgi:hypothetical protein